MFLVVGPGRCGTSTTIDLVRRSGVFIGYDLNENNEDLDFKLVNERLISGRIDLATWRRCVQFHICERAALGRPWGFKDPRIADLFDDYRKLLPDARFIRCRRPQEEVIASMCREYGWSKTDAQSVCGRRELALDLHCLAPLDIAIADLAAGTAMNQIQEFVNA